ncbi:MAG: hypothetical protein L6V93_21980 [Clostridiales bacterium]|nr:MAG: hypothetical protein L6V93_21980 [Clostridiales bacterium]
MKNTLLSENEIIFYLDKFGNITASDDSFAQKRALRIFGRNNRRGEI